MMPMPSNEETLSDSEEEIFFGPVTEKEKLIAARLKRRTQDFFPLIFWKLGSSNQSSVESKQSPRVSLTNEFLQQNERRVNSVEAEDSYNECHSVVEGDNMKNLAYSPGKLNASSSRIPVRVSKIETSTPKSHATNRIWSTANTPKWLKTRTGRKSTQLFEQYERRFLEEERPSGPQDPQTTYTVSTEETHSGDLSVASSVETERHQETYTVSSDTTSARSFTYSEYPPENKEFVDSVNTDHLGTSGRDMSSDSLGAMSNGCPDGELSDTLEEYEMLMKYGVDYILGKRKGVPETAQKNKSFGVETSGKALEILERRSTGSKSMSSSRSSESSMSNTAAPKNREITPSKASTKTPLKAASNALSPASKTPKSYHAGSVPQNNPSYFRRAASQRSPARSSSRLSPLAHWTKPNGATGKTAILSAGSTTPGNLKSKVPTKIPLSVRRTPRGQATLGRASPPSLRPGKFLNPVRSPVAAYIHDSPTPVLLKNIKPKTGPSPMSREYERKQHPVWKNVDALQNHKMESSENVNPHVGHGLRLVYNTKAPRVKFDVPPVRKPREPRMSDVFENLLDSGCPQVITQEDLSLKSSSTCLYLEDVSDVSFVDCSLLEESDVLRSEEGSSAHFSNVTLRSKKVTSPSPITESRNYAELAQRVAVLEKDVEELKIMKSSITAGPIGWGISSLPVRPVIRITSAEGNLECPTTT